MNQGAAFSNTYRCECFDADGNLKWVEEVKNLVTNEGLNDTLDKYFKGSNYSAAHYVGLKEAGTISAGDTLASHTGWVENDDYSGNRKQIVFGTVASQSVDNSASKAQFDITGAAGVAGIVVATVASRTDTSGVLYGAADFAAVRNVIANDILLITTTFTQASS